MPESSSRNPESSGDVVSCLAAELREDLAVLAGPRDAHDTRESWLARAARRAGVSLRQAKAIYYGESRDPRASVAEKIRAAARQQKSNDVETARAEIERLRARIARLEAMAASFDPPLDRGAPGPLR